MLRVLLGLLKGGVIGAGIGLGAFELGIGGGMLALVAYGVLGAAVGIVCGRAIWRQETLWTPVLKGVIGFLVGMGLYFVVRKLLGGQTLPFLAPLGAPDVPIEQAHFVLGPAIGILYGIFVEVDDGASGRREKAQAGATRPGGTSASASPPK